MQYYGGVIPSPFSDHIHLLQVSRQVNNEAAEILYGRTTFRLVIKQYALKRKWGIFERPSMPIHKMQRIHVGARMTFFTNVIDLRNLVRELVLLMAQSPSLKHLTIQLHNENHPADDARTVLQPFRMLRNLRTVTFEDPPADPARWDGTPSDVAEHLKGTMEGPMPLEYLPRMYEGLIVFTKPRSTICAKPRWLLPALSRAYHAVESEDTERFKAIRRKLIARVWWTRRMSDLTALFAADRVRPGESVEGILL